ncbi:MAG: hypothetical protein WC052_03250 [Patescibacteria group bacterium]
MSSTYVSGQGWVPDSITYPSQPDAERIVRVSNVRRALADLERDYREGNVPHFALFYRAIAAVGTLRADCQEKNWRPTEDNARTLYTRCCTLIARIWSREDPYDVELKLAQALQEYLN